MNEAETYKDAVENAIGEALRGFMRDAYDGERVSLEYSDGYYSSRITLGTDDENVAATRVQALSDALAEVMRSVEGVEFAFEGTEVYTF